MAARAGDRIVMRVKTKQLAPSARSGVIERVFSETQPRYLVRWDDGRTTVIAPVPGTISVQRGRAKAAAKKEETPAPVTPGRTKAKSAPRRTKIKKG